MYWNMYIQIHVDSNPRLLVKNHSPLNIVPDKYDKFTVILTTIVQQTGTMKRNNEPLSTDNQQLKKIKLSLISIVIKSVIHYNIF